MQVRFKEHGMVDVVDKDCRTRSCFWFGFDKGAYTPGRGYTSYHDKERKVCLERHTKGCPHPLICLDCRLLQPEGRTSCSSCRGKNIVAYPDAKAAESQGDGA